MSAREYALCYALAMVEAIRTNVPAMPLPPTDADRLMMLLDESKKVLEKPIIKQQ